MSEDRIEMTRKSRKPEAGSALLAMSVLGILNWRFGVIATAENLVTSNSGSPLIMYGFALAFGAVFAGIFLLLEKA